MIAGAKVLNHGDNYILANLTGVSITDQSFIGI